MKTKKVFVITNSLLAGGAEKQSIILTHALEKNFHTTLLVYNGNQIDENLEELVEKYSIQLILLNGSHFQKLFKLSRLFYQERPYSLISFLLTSNLISGVLGKLFGVRKRIGGISSNKLKYWKYWIELILHRYFLTHSVFNNYAGYERLLKMGFLAKKSLVIQNGVEIQESLTQINSKNKREFTLLTVGRFVPEKDYFTAIKAFYEFRKKILKVHHELNPKYLIVGYGKLENEIRSEIKSLGLEEVIEIIIKPNDLEKYYLVSDLYLSTSIQEGTSNSILEAMNYRLPIVATDAGDNKRIIRHGTSGFISNPKDILSISENILIIAKSKLLGAEMGNSGYQILKNNFSIDKLKTNFVNILES
jgi:glycosyltransferase involved in cell wall biosynthesis